MIYTAIASYDDAHIRPWLLLILLCILLIVCVVLIKQNFNAQKNEHDTSIIPLIKVTKKLGCTINSAVQPILTYNNDKIYCVGQSCWYVLEKNKKYYAFDSAELANRVGENVEDILDPRERLCKLLDKYKIDIDASISFAQR